MNWIDFLAGAASGIVLLLGAIYGLGIYARKHEERMVRFFVRRAMQRTLGAGNGSIQPPSGDVHTPRL